MVVSKKVITKKVAISKYAFAAFLIFLGVTFKILGIGNNEFFSFNSVAFYLIYVGFLMLFIVTITNFTKRNKIIDERMEKIGYKAYRWTFSIMFIAAFALMIYDGIQEIQIDLSNFISYVVCFILIIYVISYKILERYN